MKAIETEEDELWWERRYLVCRVSCYPQQGNNTPTPWQRSGQLGNLTHQATVRSLPQDLFCLCCINSFLSYCFPVGCRSALPACSMREAIIRENYAMFTQQPKVSHHWFFFPSLCFANGMFEKWSEKLDHKNAVCATKWKNKKTKLWWFWALSYKSNTNKKQSFWCSLQLCEPVKSKK